MYIINLVQVHPPILFSFLRLHLKLKRSCCIESLCPPSLQGDEIIALKIKLLTTNRWYADTRPISEHASSNRNKPKSFEASAQKKIEHNIQKLKKNEKK